jgi:TPP-dependent indolepyruvate ferredoxin oxidoreductase alpha subunit
MNNELVDLIPVVPAILRWAVENGPEEGFFLLIQNANEIAISYIEKKQVQMINTQKTKEGFTTDEIADVNELVAEIGRDTPTPIWCWGIMPGSTAYAKLSARYPLIKSLTAEELQKIKPLEIVNNDEPIVEREAWLLDAMMG